MKKLLLGLGLAALLSACSADLAQQALVTTKLYESTARVATGVVKSGVVKDCVKPKIALADNLAYGYVKELNQDAQDWLTAGADEQSAIEEAFVHTKAGAASAITALAAAPKGDC